VEDRKENVILFIFLELLFLCSDKTVTRNPNARRANEAQYYTGCPQKKDESIAPL
jgi:hypothetical protein